VFSVFGVFAFIALAVTFSFTGFSNASSMTVEERLENMAVETNVSEEEQMGDYEFDKAHSTIGFKIRHMGLVDVPGAFRNFEGEVNFDAKKIKNSKVEFTAEVKSVDTGINARDNHLRSKDFFEVQTYPEMTFKSKKVKKKGSKITVTGDLTLKGVTKEVKIPLRLYGPIKDGRGAIRMGVTGQMAINRRDFNVNYGSNLPNGTAMLSDTVVVDLQIESVKKKEKEEEK
jgi:polyisoprenoid-binding protein YceI